MEQGKRAEERRSERGERVGERREDVREARTHLSMENRERLHRSFDLTPRGLGRGVPPAVLLCVTFLLAIAQAIAQAIFARIAIAARQSLSLGFLCRGLLMVPKKHQPRPSPIATPNTTRTQVVPRYFSANLG